MKKTFFGVFVFLCLNGAVQNARAAENPLVIGNARFTVITPELIRIEYGKFTDAPSLFAMNRDALFNSFALSTTGPEAVIDTGRIRLIYRNDGKQFNPHNLSASIRNTDGSWIPWNPQLKNLGNLGGTRQSLDGVKGAVKVSDGILSRDGWYFLDDSRRQILVNDWIAERPSGAGSDGYLFGYGDDYRAGLRALTAISGQVPMPRAYTLGSWYSRWWKYSSNEFRQIIQDYHDHDFPLDVLVMDMDWHKVNDWTGYSWNRELLPDAEKLLQDVHAQGLAVTLNDHPQGGVEPFEDHYSDFMRAMGQDPASKKTLPYDMGDRKYIDTLFASNIVPLEKQGVDFWWVDWMGDGKPFNTLAWVNEYFYRHSMHDNLRGQSFSRWADFGDQRHPIHFSGDTKIKWSTLAFEVPFTAESGNAGCFYWTHDIGGFVDHWGNGGRRPPGELLARWTQFGAMSAALRLHSANIARIDKRPWKWPAEIEESMRQSYHLRSVLFPYIYSSSFESHRDSVPLIRPMYLDASRDEEAYLHPQQYYLGDAFLVAPIVKAARGSGLGHQDVWFPQGRWFDWFTGEEHYSGEQSRIRKDLNSFPLFAKGGIPIAMQPYTQRMASTPLSTLTVRAFPGDVGATGRFILYEDDGLTQDYAKGAYATTDIWYTRSDKGVDVTVAPTDGNYVGQLASRGYIIELPATGHPSGAIIGGKDEREDAPVNVEYDAQTRTTRVKIPARAIRDQLRVHVEF